MIGKKEIILSVLIFGTLLLAGNLYPQSPDSPQNGKTDQLNSEEEQKLYPKMIHPPGFYQGALLIGGAYGKSIAPNGSFVRHEKNYDKTMSLLIQNGEYTSGVEGLQNAYYEAEYIPKNTAQLEIEYGLFENFGIGMTALQYVITAKRQDYIYGSDRMGDVLYEPFPTEHQLFSGNAVMILGSFHPVSRSILDPYFTIRVGGVAYTGEAHSDLLYNPNRSSARVRNGIGKVLGAGLGMNFHVSSAMGVKIEGNYYRSFLSSDQFASRTLNTYNVQAGFFINYVALAEPR